MIQGVWVAGYGLQVTVPVTDNWVYAARPRLTIHVENPHADAVTANAQITIGTDKKTYVTTLSAAREIPAKGSDDLVLTTTEDLAPGFYKATCTVNGDLTRSFVFAINPTAIISDPDPRPDFEQFWSTAKAQLEAIDMHPVLTELTRKSTAARKVYLVELNSIPDGLSGEPVVVRGYYCEPQDGQKHPVIMHYLGYDGIYPDEHRYPPHCPSGDDAPDFAEFFLSTRGQSINNRKADEREPDGHGDFTNTYGQWFLFHFGDRDSYYYRGAFMDVVRAVDFMGSRATSDMSHLFAEGSSQGGALSYAAAALSNYPFTAIAPNVAFLGDFPDYFKIVDWPASTAKSAAKKAGLTDEQMYAFLSYFDTKNLATRIHCAVLATSGLLDGTCPPHTNIAPYNLIDNPDKEYHFYPNMTHDYPKNWWSMIGNFWKKFQ